MTKELDNKVHQEGIKMEDGVRQEDVAMILNRINEALEGTGYVATGYDNTEQIMLVLIESE